MATFLDIGLLDFFLPVFIFLFIFVVLYAIVDKTKILGENRAIKIIAALSISVISLFTGKVSDLVLRTVPWLVALFIGLILIFMVYMFFGIKEEQIWDYLGLKWTVFIIMLLIIFLGVSQVFTLSPLSREGNISEDSYRTEIISTLVHPRILGALFIIIIISFTIRFLVDKLEK